MKSLIRWIFHSRAETPVTRLTVWVLGLEDPVIQKEFHSRASYIWHADPITMPDGLRNVREIRVERLP